jgi:hypothetical protein
MNAKPHCQHCGNMGTSAYDALATIRDAVACAEVTGTPMCILSVDFQDAFDISHEYLLAILNMYGFSERFRQRIKSIYTNATSSVQINGYKSSPLPIRISIRRGIRYV